MSRKCELTGKSVMSGNNVSHAKNRTRRRFLPNLQSISFWSDALERRVSVKASTAGIRTVDKVGGIDKFVMSKAKTKLSPVMQKLRSSIEKAGKSKAASK